MIIILTLDSIFIYHIHDLQRIRRYMSFAVTKPIATALYGHSVDTVKTLGTRTFLVAAPTNPTVYNWNCLSIMNCLTPFVLVDCRACVSQEFYRSRSILYIIIIIICVPSQSQRDASQPISLAARPGCSCDQIMV